MIDLLFTSRFQASIIYYLNIDCYTIIKFLLKLLEKNFDLSFIIDTEFLQTITRLCENANDNRKI